MDEIEKFIQMVSDDHSWYKHLSFKREDPFVFYLETGYHDHNSAIVPHKRGAYGNLNYYTENYTGNFIPNEEGKIKDRRLIIGLSIVDHTGFIVPLPKEAVELGTFMMSRYLHGRAFKNGHTYFDADEPKISYAQKHEEIITDLRSHLIHMVDVLFE